MRNSCRIDRCELYRKVNIQKNPSVYLKAAPLDYVQKNEMLSFFCYKYLAAVLNNGQVRLVLNRGGSPARESVFLHVYKELKS